MESIPVEAFLEAFPEGVRRQAEILRGIVRRAVPAAVERVRPGWRLIGYDVPLARRRAYFAYIAPESEHVHLGFEHGVLMSDPEGLLEGEHLGLRKVRYVTFRPGDAVPEEPLEALTGEAARIAAMSGEERLALVMDREAHAEPNNQELRTSGT